MSYYMYSNTQEVTPYERMMAALNGEKRDRVPVHFYPRWAALEYIGVTFKQAFGIAAHTLCIGVVSFPLGMLAMWFREPGRVTPENVLPLKVGVLLSSDSPAWLRTLGGSLDIFILWLLALVAIGFSAVNRKKAPTGKAVTIVFGLWAVWVLIKMGWAANFG